MPPDASTNLPTWRSVAPGEGSLLVAEQGGFHEIVGDRAAIHGDERLAAALARPLDRPGQHLLADTGFALDQHGNVGLRRALGEPDHPIHVRALGGEILETQRSRGAAAHPPHFLFELIDAERVLDRNLQPFGAGGFDHEIDGAGPHGVHDGVDGAVRGLDDDRRVDAALPHLGEDGQPIHAAGHDEVEENHVDAFARPQQVETVETVLGDPSLEAEAAHHRLGEAALNGIVVDDQDGGGHAGRLAFRFSPAVRAQLPPGRGRSCVGRAVSFRRTRSLRCVKRRLTTRHFPRKRAWSLTGIAFRAGSPVATARRIRVDRRP